MELRVTVYNINWGIKEGEQRLLKLQQLLLESGRNEDLKRILSDEAYREQLYRENNL